jgi:small ligand-binding sensory domain FIST
MLHASSACSLESDPTRAAEAIGRALGDLGPGATSAALFFATPGHGPTFGRVEHAIREAIGGGAVVGCTAAGVLAHAIERESGPGIAAIALRGDFEVQRFFLPGLRGRAQEVGHEIGRVAATVERTPRTIVLLGDSYNMAPDELLAGVEGAAPGTTVVGAGASEDGSVGETSVIGRGAASGNAVAGLVLGGLDVRTAVVQSAAPVGGWSVVTRAESNRVLELDGKSALDVFIAQLPSLLRDDLAEALRRTRVALADDTTGAIADDPPYVVRRLLGADGDRGALVVGDEVLPGTRLAIAVRDASAARRDFAASLDAFAAGPRPAGLLYFDSVERGAALYGIADLDTAYLGQVFGDVALAGFFSGLELAPLGGRNRFHQSSGVLVGFREGSSEQGD